MVPAKTQRRKEQHKVGNGIAFTMCPAHKKCALKGIAQVEIVRSSVFAALRLCIKLLPVLLIAFTAAATTTSPDGAVADILRVANVGDAQISPSGDRGCSTLFRPSKATLRVRLSGLRQHRGLRPGGECARRRLRDSAQTSIKCGNHQHRCCRRAGTVPIRGGLRTARNIAFLVITNHKREFGSSRPIAGNHASSSPFRRPTSSSPTPVNNWRGRRQQDHRLRLSQRRQCQPSKLTARMTRASSIGFSTSRAPLFSDRLRTRVSFHPSSTTHEPRQLTTRACNYDHALSFSPRGERRSRVRLGIREPRPGPQ